VPEPTWNPGVELVQDGETVDAAVVNRPVETLATNDNYLKERLDNAALGQQLVYVGVAFSPAVEPDMPVAWNPATGRFEPALAGVVVDPSTAALYPGVLAQCVGVCRDKDTATSGTILGYGRYATKLASVVVGTPQPGTYYLSTQAPGGLVPQRPPASSPVLYWDGTYAYVAPQGKDALAEHTHYTIPLHAAPAGTAHVVGDRQLLVTADPTKPGWLPAHHASFAGKAPPGAIFGYNLAAHPALAALWPPTPLSSVVFVRDLGQAHVGGTICPQGPRGLVQATRDGIWWNSDCLGDAPWAPGGAGFSDSSTGSGDCSRPEQLALYVGFTEMLFATGQATVTSLRPATGSAIAVVDAQGDPASAGDLFLQLALGSIEGPPTTPGSVVLKGLVSGGFSAGHVLEGLVEGAGVTLTALDGVTRPLGGGATLYQGQVQIDLSAAVEERELTPQVVRLYGATEAPYGNLFYLGLPAGRASAVGLKIAVPYAGIAPGANLAIRVWLYAPSAGDMPALTFTVLQLARETSTPTSVPSPNPMGGLGPGPTMGAGQYIEQTTAAINVDPGDLLFVTISRSASDGYADAVGILRVAGIVLGS
jgi:hypothetical protein